MCITKKTGKVIILKAVLDCYPNLRKAVGRTLPCTVEEFDCGNKLFKVAAIEFKELGCDVGACTLNYPLYGKEIEELLY